MQQITCAKHGVEHTHTHTPMNTDLLGLPRETAEKECESAGILHHMVVPLPACASDATVGLSGQVSAQPQSCTTMQSTAIAAVSVASINEISHPSKLAGMV